MVVGNLMQEVRHDVRILGRFLEAEGVQGSYDFRLRVPEGIQEKIVPVLSRHRVHEVGFAVEHAQVFDNVELITLHGGIEELSPPFPWRLDDDLHRAEVGGHRPPIVIARHKMTCMCFGYPSCADIQSLFPNVIFECTTVLPEVLSRAADVVVDRHTWRKIGEKNTGVCYFKCTRCDVRKRISEGEIMFKASIKVDEYHSESLPCSPKRRKRQREPLRSRRAR